MKNKLRDKKYHKNKNNKTKNISAYIKIEQY